jgi:hypothetical protein
MPAFGHTLWILLADLELAGTQFDALFDLFGVWAVATTVVATIASTTQVGSSEDHKLAFKIVIHAFS